MASYHVRNTSGEGSSFQAEVEYHIPVPDEMNETNSVNIRDALAVDTDFEKTSDVATPQELTDLASGALVKWLEPYRLNGDQPLANHRKVVRAKYDQLVDAGIDRLRSKYRFLGNSEIKGVDF